MGISLYDITIGTSRQALEGVSTFLAKGREHCEAAGHDLQEIADCRLVDDMLGFGFQIASIVHHSLGSIQGVFSGEFRPPQGPYDGGYAVFEQRIKDAREALAAYDEAEVNACEGGRVIFHLGKQQIPFSTEHFVLSFSHPNLFFHATTAYDLLRLRGVPLGKRDFLGSLRIER